MTMDTDATVVIPVGSLALCPIPAAGFSVVIVKGVAGRPAGVEQMVVVEHPVGTGVVEAGVLVVLTGRLEHAPLPVANVILNLVLIVSLLLGNVRYVSCSCRVSLFLDRTFVDPDGGLQAFKQFIHEAVTRVRFQTVHLSLIQDTRRQIVFLFLKTAVNYIEDHSLV